MNRARSAARGVVATDNRMASKSLSGTGKSSPRWLRTVLLITTLAITGGCGGGGGDGSEGATAQSPPSPPAPPVVPTPPPPPPPPEDPATYSGSGLWIEVETEDGTNVSTVAGERSRHYVFLSKADPDIQVQVTMAGGVTGIELRQDRESFYVAVDGTVVPAGSSVPLSITAENTDNHEREVVDIVVNVLEIARVASGAITTAGGVVSSDGGAVGVHIGPGQLSRALGIEIFRATTRLGVAKIRVRFSRDVSQETALMSFTSNLKWADSASLKPDLAHTVLRLPVHQKLTKPYPIVNSVQSFAGFFLRDASGGPRVLRQPRRLSDWIRLESTGDPCLGNALLCVDIDARAATLSSSKPESCFGLDRERYLASPECNLARAGTDSRDLGNFVPVLLVHGFKAGGDLGGGSDTWNDFPALLNAMAGPNNEELVAFEFRWRTNASLRVVADDLASAIRRTYDLTGEPVRIVAHSFGGALVRTLLQGLAQTSVEFDSAYVHSVMTIVTPHSGIFPEATVSPTSGQVFPDGQDRWTFDLCGQVSCLQMGEPVSFSAGWASLADAGQRGELIADLADFSSNPLPTDLPVVVALGLKREGGSNDKYDDGDGLISFNGQRFFPDLSRDYVASQETYSNLLDCRDSSPHGLVTEIVLGPLDKDGKPIGNPQPFGPVPRASESDDAVLARGYSHSAAVDPDNEIEYAAPYVVDCSPSDRMCQEHATLTIFRHLIQSGQGGAAHRYCVNAVPPSGEGAPEPSLLGYQMTLVVEYPNKGTAITVPYSVLVTEGTEILGGEIQYARTFGSIIRSDQDIGADYIQAVYIGSGRAASGDFSGLAYYFEPRSPRIVNAWLDAASDFSEAEARVSFDEHTVWVDLAGVYISIGEQFVVRLELERSPRN